MIDEKLIQAVAERRKSYAETNKAKVAAVAADLDAYELLTKAQVALEQAVRDAVDSIGRR